MPKLNVLVAGSTGYIGIQLIKLLIKHDKVNIKYLCGSSSVGKNISTYEKSINSKKLPKIVKYNKSFLKNVDLVFTALPNGEAQTRAVTIGLFKRRLHRFQIFCVHSRTILLLSARTRTRRPEAVGSGRG